jgi:Cu/Ag efflux protein CusF
MIEDTGPLQTLYRRDMNRLALKITLFLFLTTLFCCSKAQSPASAQSATLKRYPLKGKIVSIDKPGKMAIVDAEAIPGFMGAMAMPYKVKPESDLDKLSAGDTITANLIVEDDNYWLENVAVTGHGPPPASK